MKKMSVIAVALAAMLVVMLSGFAGLQRHKESSTLDSQDTRHSNTESKPRQFNVPMMRERELVDGLLQGDAEEAEEASAHAGKNDPLDDLLGNPG